MGAIDLYIIFYSLERHLETARETCREEETITLRTRLRYISTVKNIINTFKILL